ncbi:hypothetical protein FRC02_002615 [Tulasnella sp. 418]|nr:hypothetical protein FRC02_002615 [Tulasnella sp. 418]
MPPTRPQKNSKQLSPSPSSDEQSAKKSKDRDDKLKRKRQSQSCDACRARKVRCARPEPLDGSDPPSPTGDNSLIPMTTGPDGKKEVAQCKHCIALGIKCTYDYQPKKRGPPNLYLRRLQEAAAAAALAQHGGQPSPTPIVPSHQRPTTHPIQVNSAKSLMTPTSPSGANSNPYFSSANSSQQVVVPSQSPSIPTHYNGSTHSFMDTNTLNPSPSSTGAVTLPSLPSLWSASNTNGADWISAPTPQQAQQQNLQHVPMHLQPSPARLSPILGPPSNAGLPTASSSGGTAPSGTGLQNTNMSLPIPPSRYPIAADLVGMSNSIGGSSNRPSTSLGLGGLGKLSKSPPPGSASSTKSGGSTLVDDASAISSGAKSNGIGQIYGHYSTSSSGGLPAFVHSRANSPVGGESSNANGSISENTMVPLTPGTAAEIFPAHPLYNWSMPYKEIDQVSMSGSITSPTMIVGSTAPRDCATIHPPLIRFHRPHQLRTLADPSLIMHILALFFEFVYPLTPCVHKPSFYRDLQEKREERDPLFFALVCSTVASTLVQVPRSCLPMERNEVRKMAKRFSEASRLITVAGYDPPSSMIVVIRYFDCVYHFCEGHDATQHAAFGEAAHIAVTLHMHEEASYEGLDFIESEVRRRVFWLLFGADKSMAVLLGRPICLRDEDCTLHFPREVDDEYITAHAILPQPPHKTAIISGFNYITRIFALLGEILVRIRVDKRSPPTGPFATARLEEVQALHGRICAALMHAPPELRLKSGVISSNGITTNGVNGFGHIGMEGFTKHAFAEVKEYFDNPTVSREAASNPFLVMQANLYVTQQLVRFVIEQYRDELVTSMRESGEAPMLPERSLEDREAVASDLLNVLHSIPIQSIATNGPSLVHKVRFVASTLLDAVRRAETAPASAARAHAYLWEFLSILSEIERNYL